MLAQSVIVYRSESEKVRDEFFNQVLAPWVAEHWLIVIVGFVAVFAFAQWLQSRKGGGRW